MSDYQSASARPAIEVERLREAGAPARAVAVDLPTVVAIAIVVYLTSALAHELFGHGGACVLVGGKPIAFSSSSFQSDSSMLAPWSVRIIKAGGTVVNLALGALAFAWLWLWPPRNVATRYALWLAAAVNSFRASGYLMSSPLFGWGDWGDFVEGLQAAVAWKIGLTIVGCALGAVQLFVAFRLLNPIVGDSGTRRARGQRLTLFAYLTGGVVSSAAGGLSALGPQFAITSAAAAFGGTAFLAWLGAWIRPACLVGEPGPALHCSKAWLVAGAAALVLFGVFGRGVAL